MERGLTVDRWAVSEWQTRGRNLPVPTAVMPDLMKKQMKCYTLLFASPPPRQMRCLGILFSEECCIEKGQLSGSEDVGSMLGPESTQQGGEEVHQPQGFFFFYSGAPVGRRMQKRFGGGSVITVLTAWLGG